MSSSRRLLLDTHVFLWWRTDTDRLRPEIIETVATAAEVFVSAASAWEISIKKALGRLELPEPVSTGVAASGFRGLDVKFVHAERVAELPHHHRDPFDRLLVAQAQVECLELVTRDEQIKDYEVQILVA